MLQGDHGLRIAAIVNDSGSINIDAALLESSADSVIGLKNGCICCSLQGDLLRTLKRVLGHGANPELIVIEASGVADPAGILQSLIDPVIWHQARLDIVACVIDALDVAERKDDPLWQAQVRGSDVLCLAKSALLTASELGALNGRLSLEQGRYVYDLAEAFPLDASLVPDPDRPERKTGTPLRDRRVVHLAWQHDRAVSLAAFQSVIGQIAPKLLRAKGFVALKSQADRVVFQLVGRRATFARKIEDQGAGCELVLIGDREIFDISEAHDLLGRLR